MLVNYTDRRVIALRNTPIITQRNEFYEIYMEGAPHWIGKRDSLPNFAGMCHVYPGSNSVHLYSFRRIASDGKQYLVYSNPLEMYSTHLSCRWRSTPTEIGEHLFSCRSMRNRPTMMVGYSFLETVPAGEIVDPESNFWYEWQAAIVSIGASKESRVFDSWKEYSAYAGTPLNKYLNVFRYICEGVYCLSANRMSVKKLDWMRKSHGDSRIILRELLDLGIAVVESNESYDYIFPNPNVDILTAVQVLAYFRD